MSPKDDSVKISTILIVIPWLLTTGAAFGKIIQLEKDFDKHIKVFDEKVEQFEDLKRKYERTVAQVEQLRYDNGRIELKVEELLRIRRR